MDKAYIILHVLFDLAYLDFIIFTLGIKIFYKSMYC